MRAIFDRSFANENLSALMEADAPAAERGAAAATARARAVRGDPEASAAELGATSRTYSLPDWNAIGL